MTEKEILEYSILEKDLTESQAEFIIQNFEPIENSNLKDITLDYLYDSTGKIVSHYYRYLPEENDIVEVKHIKAIKNGVVIESRYVMGSSQEYHESHDEKAICPFCECEIDAPYEYFICSEDGGPIDCGSCEKRIHISREITSTYTLSPWTKTDGEARKMKQDERLAQAQAYFKK